MQHRRFSLLAAASGLVLAASAHAQAPATDAQEIIVSAQKTNQTQVAQGGQVGVLGDKDGLDVPFNIRSYSSALILNQQLPNYLKYTAPNATYVTLSDTANENWDFSHGGMTDGVTLATCASVRSDQAWARTPPSRLNLPRAL